jgi:rod shape determining protein RodA
MLNIIPRQVAEMPWQIIFITLAIASFGVVVLYSAAGGSLSPWAGTHAIRFVIFLIMALVIRLFSENFIKLWTYPGYIVLAVLLLMVELVGAVKGGSQRWIDLGFIRLQPSELMKPLVVLAIARFYELLPIGQARSWAAIWPPLVMIGIPCALVLTQPDLGTTIAILTGGATVMFLAGIPLRLFIGAGLAGAAFVPIAYFFLLEEYQQKRVTTFLDPESDPLGTGYHISQSKIAIGSGGIDGKGFLQGSQSHLDYLPEGHTDFVFATMAEEWGLIGGLVVIGLFALLLRWATAISLNASSRFGKLAGGGLTMVIFFYIAINLMMVMGLAPVVGIPLPFLSYGGSSMMTIMICIGLLMGIERNSRTASGSGGRVVA